MASTRIARCMESPSGVWHHASACIPLSFGLDSMPSSTDSIRSLREQFHAAFGGLGTKGCVFVMTKNPLLDYSQELASKIELFCQSLGRTGGNANTIFQIRKSSSSVYANISEAQYPQSLADMLSKFEIARKECMETESWLMHLLSTGVLDESTFKPLRNLCGRIRRMLTASCITIEKKLSK